MKVWVDGVVVEADQARVSVFDHGLTVGDGVFETAKVVDGVPFALTRHLDRLASSASGLGLTPPDDVALRDAVGAQAASGASATTRVGPAWPRSEPSGLVPPVRVMRSRSGPAATASALAARVAPTASRRAPSSGGVRPSPLADDASRSR